jgi:cell division protein FtsB
MPTFDITLNVYVFLLIIGLSLLLGFLPRSRQLSKKQRKSAELEQDVMQANAEVLDNQRAFIELEKRMKEMAPPAAPANPVIQLKGKNRPTGTD